ncbi:hypothetical protein GEMRC1_004155 [Eukaryota sp. GEM-RC1]
MTHFTPRRAIGDFLRWTPSFEEDTRGPVYHQIRSLKDAIAREEKELALRNMDVAVHLSKLKDSSEFSKAHILVGLSIISFAAAFFLSS